MKQILAALCCASLLSPSFAEPNTTASLVLQKEYEYLGAVAEKQHRPDDALWFYEQAASLSVNALEGNDKMYCGSVAKIGRVMYFRKEVCAKTRPLCAKVIALNVLVEFKKETHQMTAVSRCKVQR